MPLTATDGFQPRPLKKLFTANQCWTSFLDAGGLRDIEVEAVTKMFACGGETTQSGACPWEYARVLLRKGQGLQASFEQPVKSQGEGFLSPSKTALKDWLNKKEKLSGSLFGKQGDYEWGEDLDYSIDRLIADLQSHL